MGNFRNKRKTFYSRRSRSQRLRRLREKCQKELSLALESAANEPAAKQPKRKQVDNGSYEVQTFSEIIIHATSEAAESASQDRAPNFPHPELRFTNVVCRPSPLSTPLLDSKISSYINCHSRMQPDTGNPLAEMQVPRDGDIFGNPLLSGRAMFDTGFVIEDRDHACSFGGKLVFDRMVGEGYRYVCSKHKCGETRMLKLDKEK